MSSGKKAARLIVGAYAVTMGMAVLVVTLAIMILVEPHSCSAMTRALLGLWTTIAVLFLASILVVGVVAWKFIPSVQQRWAIVVVYGMMMLASYVFVAFGLLVAFNC
jgi:hypothetical protein